MHIEWDTYFINANTPSYIYIYIYIDIYIDIYMFKSIFC